jgi:hypothetical protein
VRLTPPRTRRLARLARLRTEAVDERLHVSDLALLAREERGLLRERGGPLLLEGGIIAAIGTRAALLDMDYAISHPIEELAVVSDQQ